MALWPFRRKSARKRPRSGAALSDGEGPPPRAMTEGAVARAGSIKKQRTEPTKLQRRARTHSFSPDRQEVLQVDRAARAQRPQGDGAGDLQHVAWDRTPTLHHGKNSGRKPSRRKSSKRRKRDPNREAEIKAMSNFMPVRPATDPATAGRPMRKESQRVKSNAINRPWDNQPASDVSLPIPESIHSSMSSDSEFGSFRVSALDALAPRPTLRYAPGSRWPAARASGPARTASQKKTLAERGPLPKETLRAHKRIDELADDLDASDLRELMERDTRRRQQQRQRDQQRMEERLSRRAQTQRAEEAEAKKSGTPPPENLERGVLGRELVGLGIEPASAVVTSSKIRNSVASESMPDAEPDAGDEAARPNALDTFHRADTVPMDEDESEATPAPKAVLQNDIQPPPQAVTLDADRKSPSAEPEEKVASLPSGSVFAGLLRRNKSRSKSTLGSDRDKTVTPPFTKYDDDEKLRKNSEASASKPGRFSLSSLLRRGKNRRGSSGHPSFSNTSREEMQAVAYAQAHAQQQSQSQQSQEQLPTHSFSQAQAMAQAHALAKLEGKDMPTQANSSSGRYVAKSGSAVPKRTRSRFREDLPEFPLSPPASRVQSPEAEPPLPPVTETKQETETQPVPIPTARYDTPASGHRSVEGMRMTPTSPDPHQSMSLASIDSEGSWLSGRVNAQRASAMRDSLAPSSRREPVHSSDSPTNSTQEDLAIMEDEYLSRLTPSAERNSLVKSLSHRSGDGRPSSDEEDFLDDSDLKWGTVAGAHPHVVDRETMRSRHGMLNAVEGDDEQSSPESPSSRVEEKADLGRARSVDLAKRGHARNFSAGSAKLLEIHPRSSVDGKTGFKDRRASEPLA